jgi:geranylgeranyl transferase type-2 subunit beta
MQLGYLDRLTLQLTAGAALLPMSFVERHAKYITQKQRTDGGWAGREGNSDLYYTSFALRSLAILGYLEGEVAEKSAAFLRQQTQSQQSIVDILSLVYGARLIEAACGIDPFADCEPLWVTRFSDLLDSLRRNDGGFSKSIQGQAGSTYQTFLVAICRELLGTPLPSDDPAGGFLQSQRQVDGGFLEVRVAKRSGTNPTAAAIGGLTTLNRLDADVAERAAQFLFERQMDEGGFAANTRMPLPDLLSTFTGCLTLKSLNALDQIELDSARRYALSMERTDGGFAGFELDPSDDVEYTFYGLGTLSLLAL